MDELSSAEVPQTIGRRLMVNADVIVAAETRLPGRARIDKIFMVLVFVFGFG